MNERVWHTQGLLIFTAAMVTTLVGSGIYSRRYRHHGFARFLFLGASTLYLPIVSYLVSGIGEENCDRHKDIKKCEDMSAFFLVAWAILVLIVGANSCVIVAADDDDHQGRNVGRRPVMELLVRAIWTSYLAVHHLKRFYPLDRPFVLMSCGFVLGRIVVKVYAFVKAQRSFAHGRNPRVIAGYMDQMKQDISSSHHLQAVNFPLPLVVFGEDEQQVEEGPRGYRFEDKKGNESLVTLSKIQIISSMDGVLSSWPPLKDLCLSFSLFKLLRRRFARCPVVEEGSEIAPNMVCTLFDGDPESIISIIADELSFSCDFYHSSLPVSCSAVWILTLNILFSFVGIAYCLFIAIRMIEHVVEIAQVGSMSPDPYFHQITCVLMCDTNDRDKHFGSILFFMVLSFFLAIVLMFDEAWEIVSYMCSKWTKVTLICYYITKPTWQQSPRMRRLIRRVLGFRCNLLGYWSDRMGQTSIMDTNMDLGLIVSIKHLLRLPDQTKQVKIPKEVKAALVNTLKTRNWRLTDCITSLQQSQIGKSFSWACKGEGTSDVILVWHIATSMFEIRHANEPSNALSLSNRITATHLSRYCAYLLSSTPELLPDDKAWSKKSYESVKKIVETIFSGSNERPLEYEYMLLLLDEKYRSSTILTKGLTLGKQLVEEIEDEEMGWRVLAGFWSEMILYIAPSDNVNAHTRAIARGGELITILWALLTHAGIVSRPSTSTGV